MEVRLGLTIVDVFTKPYAQVVGATMIFQPRLERSPKLTTAATAIWA
jgi:hypothetical protein